ncbi:MAG: ATP-binding protein [Isosphaeraceae bacterium]
MTKLTTWALRYGVAVVAVGAAIGVLFIPEIGKGLVSVLFLAVLVSAWYGGLGPGLLATFLVAVVAVLNLVLVQPDFAPWRVVSIMLFVGGGVLITLLVEALHAARRRVEASQQWLTAVLSSIGDAVIATDSQGRATFLNPVAEILTGWESREAVGRSLTDIFRIVTEETGVPVENPVNRVLREGVIVALANHTILIARDGAERPIDDSGAPIREKGGAIIGVVLVFRDITERKRLEQERRRRLLELAEANRRKDEFLAMLAHELRNPLAVISNAVQLSSLTGVQDQINWCMEVINRQVKVLSRLIDDLLEVSRITRGKIQLRKEPLDVAIIVHSAIESVRPLIEAREHKVTVKIAPEPLLVEADPVRLEQVLANLLTNAAKYTDIGGQIWLSAEWAEEAIVIKVRDAGIGIAPEQLPWIFELFAQGHHTLARSEGGLGIGLTLARALLEMHGGSVTATSAGPGKGSEFVVRLPAVVPPTADPTAPTTQAEPVPQRGSRILVIDDNLDLAHGLANLLKLLNHEVWIAPDGPAGLEAARGHRPEVVLLDIGLPGMDGYQVAEQLRREDFGRDLLLIAVTGYGNEEDRRRARFAGFDQFVTKPVDHATLLALLAAPGSAAT